MTDRSPQSAADRLALALKAFQLEPEYVSASRDVPPEVVAGEEITAGGVVIVTHGGIKLRYPEDLEPERARTLHNEGRLSPNPSEPRWKRLLRGPASRDGVPRRPFKPDNEQ